MPTNQQTSLDPTDAALVRALQRDGRATLAELGREVSMSASSVADRVRRLTDAGVLTGVTATVDAAAVGLPLLAFARVRMSAGSGRTFHDLLADEPHVIEAHHLTGDDCFLLKIVASSMLDLEELIDKLALFGQVTTNLVFSSPVQNRPVPVAGIDRPVH